MSQGGASAETTGVEGQGRSSPFRRVQRVLTPLAWREVIRCEEKALLFKSINPVVWKVMAELRPDPLTSTTPIYGAPWAPSTMRLHGALWAGVPGLDGFFRDEGGGWTATDSLGVPALRLCPAEANGEVQYGFCLVRLTKFDEIATETLGPIEEWKVKLLHVTPNCESDFRVDKIVVAAVALGDPSNTSEEALRFRHLLETTPLSAFIKDILRGCFRDGGGRNILRDRDAVYKEMVHLICMSLYPNLKTGRSHQEIRRLKHLMGMDADPRWEWGRLFPYLYNVVMPQSILDSIGENLEKGIPPIVPQYATPGVWMFNGPSAEPCTHLDINLDLGVDGMGAKLLAGVLNKFNLDLPGGVSYWPTEYNPPQEWTDTFVRCLRELGSLALPLSISERSDLALEIARQIPVMLIAEPMEKRFARLTDSQVDGEDLSSVTIQECNETGQELVPVSEDSSENPSVATQGGTGQDLGSGQEDDTLRVCDLCRRTYPLEDGTICQNCEQLTCRSCFSECLACRRLLCSVCVGDHLGCAPCTSCGGAFCTEALTRCECSGCEGRMRVCDECSDQHYHRDEE